MVERICTTSETQRIFNEMIFRNCEVRRTFQLVSFTTLLCEENFTAQKLSFICPKEVREYMSSFLPFNYFFYIFLFAPASCNFPHYMQNHITLFNA